MNAGLPDIRDRADCERLVRAFYSRALADPVIGFIFNEVARLDLEAHVPRITSFWETILLGGQSYTGGAFRPHAALHARVRLRRGHFERWLWLWSATVDELFTGERAERAKAHAARVAAAFHARLEGLTVGGDGQPEPGTASRLAVVSVPAGGVLEERAHSLVVPGLDPRPDRTGDTEALAGQADPSAGAENHEV